MCDNPVLHSAYLTLFLNNLRLLNIYRRIEGDGIAPMQESSWILTLQNQKRDLHSLVISKLVLNFRLQKT